MNAYREIVELNAFSAYAHAKQQATAIPLSHYEFGGVAEDIATVVSSVVPAATNLYTAIANPGTQQQLALQQQQAQYQAAMYQQQLAAQQNTGLNFLGPDTMLYLGIGGVALVALFMLSKKSKKAA